MANQIDNTYFIGDISLPIDQVAGKITQCIKTYEPEILKAVLGFDLYKNYLIGLAENPILSKWTDLQNGKDFQVDSIWYNWRGFLNTNKESIIAFYVWLKFVQTDGSYISGAGIKQTESENSTVDNTYRLLTINYNKMVDMINELDFFINSNLSDYENYWPKTFTKILPL